MIRELEVAGNRKNAVKTRFFQHKITKNKFDNTIKYLLANNFNFSDNGRYYLSIKADDLVGSQQAASEILRHHYGPTPISYEQTNRPEVNRLICIKQFYA